MRWTTPGTTSFLSAAGCLGYLHARVGSVEKLWTSLVTGSLFLSNRYVMLFFAIQMYFNFNIYLFHSFFPSFFSHLRPRSLRESAFASIATGCKVHWVLISELLLVINLLKFQTRFFLRICSTKSGYNVAAGWDMDAGGWSKRRYLTSRVSTNISREHERGLLH